MQPLYKADSTIKVIAEHYEQIVEEETELMERIRTCEAYLNAILEQTYRNGDQHHKLTVEDILTAVFTISSELRTELLHVQFEKALLSCRMKQDK
ncbi:hypothetical protein [Paenibacillus whitsoniae]|uniref:Uncharacterized protein n=1 Tax=Paenibacillus whitsoniae TaxID=2496558 RepID=A0A3S0BYM1_9BACL|nr:hypothetical protein [Paenibacillus whitsoniae]RTE11193.1 hypothetical protein EJQ19_02575 [Paenibacillus whitsoniae]